LKFVNFLTFLSAEREITLFNLDQNHFLRRALKNEEEEAKKKVQGEINCQRILLITKNMFTTFLLCPVNSFYVHFWNFIMHFLYPFYVDFQFVNNKERTFKRKVDIWSCLFYTFSYFNSNLGCSGSHFPESTPCPNNCPLFANFVEEKFKDVLFGNCQITQIEVVFGINCIIYKM
jgi:hypothetical protein